MIEQKQGGVKHREQRNRHRGSPKNCLKNLLHCWHLYQWYYAWEGLYRDHEGDHKGQRINQRTVKISKKEEDEKGKR